MNNNYTNQKQCLHNIIGHIKLTWESYFQRCRFCPVQATIRTLSAISSVTSSSGVSRHTDSSVIRDPDHTLESSPSSGAMTNMSAKDGRPWTSQEVIPTGPMGWFSEPRPEGFSKQRFDSMCFILMETVLRLWILMYIRFVRCS